ncbi:hypothetical protein ALI22I_36930 [Saccharothrix sp. ALI-22-I]|uniref:hypothetical protein n=1 Tax=Saccharothrix sp. ALI-22-I TaxID=1933778 RepID=UPI00097C0E5B|nr:hypothetical protein [Saccharothrix sp. ALI-22-I]ONI81795.1 hypothetical protein ALI22I_36930 [Saccharothrix sp. ALI-22-I]
MGRALQKSPAPRRLAVVAALATGLGLVAAGCSAGQVTQTDTQVAAVNGASGQAGDIAVRDAQFLFPVEHGSYEQGDDAPIMVVIANNGTSPDKLLAVTSEFSEPAELTGDVELESSSAIVGGADQDDAGSHTTTTTTTPSAPSGSATTTTTPSGATTTTGSATTTTGSATTTTGDDTSISNPPTTPTKIPSSVDPTEPGVVKIVLKGLKKPLRPGETIRVTFLFQNAGEVTLELPIGATTEPRKDEPSEH